MPQEQMKFRVDDAEIFWPNFSGKPTPFKTDTSITRHRSFNVLLDKASADKLALDGWSVKCKAPDEYHDVERCFIEIIVKYRDRKGEKVKPPKIVIISSKGQTVITEDTIDMVDDLNIKKVDLIARSYNWSVGEKSGISAYLQTMYATLDEDELDAKYANVEDAE